MGRPYRTCPLCGEPAPLYVAIRVGVERWHYDGHGPNYPQTPCRLSWRPIQ